MINYYILDTETTGLKPGYHEINQISIIRLSDKFQRTFNIAISHPNRVSDEALKVQKRSKSDLLKGKSIGEVANALDEFFLEDGASPDSRCIVGHNISFDRNFLFATWNALGKTFPVSLWLCTKTYAKAYTKKYGEEEFRSNQGETKAKYGLDNCLKGLGLSPKTGAHSAAVDTQNNLTLYNALQDKKIDHIMAIKKVAHAPTNTSYLEDFE